MYNDVSNKKIRLLIVEDDKLFKIYLKEIFEKDSSIEVIAEADDGQVAIDLANDLKPDAVLMDLGLPVLCGVIATKRIIEMNLGIKIIAITAHNNEEEAIRVLAAGANAYVRKDINANELIMIIHTVKRGAVWLDSSIGNKILSQSAACYRGKI